MGVVYIVCQCSKSFGSRGIGLINLCSRWYESAWFTHNSTLFLMIVLTATPPRNKSMWEIIGSNHILHSMWEMTALKAISPQKYFMWEIIGSIPELQSNQGRGTPTILHSSLYGSAWFTLHSMWESGLR